jgi:hypothetical protein
MAIATDTPVGPDVVAAIATLAAVQSARAIDLG